MPVRTLECPNCGEPQPDDLSALMRDLCWKCQKPLTIEHVGLEKEQASTADSLKKADTVAITRDNSDEVDAPPEPTIGRIGRFELRAAIGQGAFGKVFRAYDPMLDRAVAIKVPRNTLDQPKRINRFLREAKAAARLRHPNIVAVFESGQAGDEYFIVSEFVRGVPLSDKMAERRPEIRDAVRWVEQIAEGLAYAHSEGVIHRDIKPANIMLGEGGRPQLMDFGMAKRLDEDATMTTEGALLGTPAYMSPEQARSDIKAVGARSDQYSLGVVLYELLTGRKPFDGLPHIVITRVTNTEPPPPRSINKAIPADLEAICLKAMAKDPLHRYPTVADFRLDLERWLRGEHVHARHALWWERLWRWCRREPSLAAMTAGFAASLLLAAGLGVTFAIYESRIAGQLKDAVDRAQAQRMLAETAQKEATFQSQRTSEALRDVQSERDQKTIALVESEMQRERAQAALAEAEQQRTRAELALQDLQASRVEAESERMQVRRLRTESYLDRGLRQCGQGDAVQGMLWLAEALKLASETPELSEYARVARENLAAWRPYVLKAKKQRTGEVVLDASLDGANVLRGMIKPGDLRPDPFRAETRWETLFNYDDPVAVVFSDDARTALVLERQSRQVQAHLLGGGLAASTPAFERGKVFRSQNHPVASLSASGRRALIQEEANVATLWDVRARQTADRPLISLGSRRIQALTLSPNGKLAACLATRSMGGTANAGSSLLIFDCDSARQIGERDLAAGSPALLAFHPQGLWLLAGDQLFDSRTLEPILAPFSYSEPMRAATVNPEGSIVATASTRSVWLWDTAGKLVREIPCNHDVDDVTFDLNGLHVVTRGRSMIQVWDTKTGRSIGPPVEAITGMQPFLSACFSADGLLVAAARSTYRIPRTQSDLSGTANQLRLWVQVLTEAELAKDGSVRLLNDAAWGSRLEALRQLTKTPG